MNFEKFRPQKARPFSVRRDNWLFDIKDCDGIVAEIKRNGHRYFASRESMYSSTWHKRCMPYQESIVGDCLLDGEICYPGYDKISSDVTHGLSEGDFDNLKFFLFDMLYDENGESLFHLPFKERRIRLEQYYNMYLIDNDMFELNEVFREDIRDLVNQLRLEHAEGLVFKYEDRTYSSGGRSNFIKYKFTDTVDVVIVDADSLPSKWRVRPGCIDTNGVLQVDGVYTDSWSRGYKGLSYGWYDTDGILRKVGSLGITGHYDDLRKYVGRVAEVKVWGVFPTGAVQHPSFQCWRELSDKTPDECVFDFVNGVQCQS